MLSNSRIKQKKRKITNHEENGSFHSLKTPQTPKTLEYLKQNFFILKKKNHMILPTITISSKMFVGKKHYYIKKCSYNSSAFLLCLQPGLICVKGVLNDWFITENTGGRVDPGFLTAVLWVRHPRLQQHLPGPFYNCTRTKLQLYGIK